MNFQNGGDINSRVSYMLIEDGKKLNDQGRHSRLREYYFNLKSFSDLFIPTVSVSDRLYIEFFGTTNSVFSFNLLVYACGGTAKPNVPFISPNFTKFDNVDQIKCRWTFSPYQSQKRKARIFQLKVV